MTDRAFNCPNCRRELELPEETRALESNSETGSKALGNSKEVFDKHYLKPTAVLPDVRKAVKRAVSGLVQ